MRLLWVFFVPLLFGCSYIELPVSPAVSTLVSSPVAPELMYKAGRSPSKITLVETQKSSANHTTYYFRLDYDKETAHLPFEGLYFKSVQDGKKKAIIVLPIYGSSEIPSASIAAHLMDRDTNVLLIRETGDIFDWHTLSRAETKKEFSVSIHNSVKRF